MELFVKTSADHLSDLLEKEVDGIIVGVEGFSVRMKENVAPSALAMLAAKTKRADKRLWLNLNAFIHETALDALEVFLGQIAELPIDGVLFADFAIMRLAEKKGLVSRLVYHAETSPTFAEDVRFFERAGVQAVVLGRELTIKSMETIAAKTEIPLVFVGHGRLNMFHSRRRLLSNYFAITESDDEKGMPEDSFTLREESRNEHYPVYEDIHGTHIFRDSPTQSFTVWERLEKILSFFIVDGLFYDERRLREIVDDCIAVQKGARGGDIAKKYPDHDEGFFFRETFAKEEEEKKR